MNKLDSLIAGLTMLRAYGIVERVQCSGADEPSHDTCGHIWVRVNKPASEMHADDVRRIRDEGWWWEDQSMIWEFDPCD